MTNQTCLLSSESTFNHDWGYVDEEPVIEDLSVASDNFLTTWNLNVFQLVSITRLQDQVSVPSQLSLSSKLHTNVSVPLKSS